MDVLADLIAKANREFSAEYAIGDVGGISNHLPMCLFALRKLGADDVRLQNFYSSYSDSLLPRKTSENFQPEVWQRFLGRNSFNVEFHNLFRSRIGSVGVEKCLVDSLAELLPGIGGAAFHPLIRLAYALELGQIDEIAEALASWGMGYVDFGGFNLNKPRSSKSPEEILRLFSVSDLFPSEKYQGPSVVARMQAAANDEDFWSLFAIPVDLRLDQMANCAIRIFLSKPTFTGLHLVTSCHAARVLSEKVGPIGGLLENLWLPFCLAYVTTGAPKVLEDFKDDRLEWNELFEKAIHSDNDHWCKFVHTCSEENKVYRSRYYQLAATKYLNG